MPFVVFSVSINFRNVVASAGNQSLELTLGDKGLPVSRMSREDFSTSSSVIVPYNFSAVMQRLTAPGTGAAFMPPLPGIPFL